MDVYQAHVVVSMGDVDEEDYLSEQEDGVEPPPLSLKKQVTAQQLQHHKQQHHRGAQGDGDDQSEGDGSEYR